jgi:ribosomal protein S18 acetylase RimI-like enzyme
MRIRPMTPDDVEALRQIEWDACECFRELGMDAVADDEPPTPAQLLDHHRAGLAWVTVDEAGRPVAYLIAEEIDGSLHVEQVSVHPRAARRGLGRDLVEHAAEEGRQRGLAALTLTTFTEVPWNGPYYLRIGFRVLADDELTPGLRAVQRHETAIGLDAWPRACLRRDL